jgi:hypothetical protein
MPLPRAVVAFTDWLAFSSLLPAAIASGLLLAAATALGVSLDGVSAGLAAVGTLVVYNVDRLRDTGTDRVSAPLRTGFVEQHRRGLWLLTAGATTAAVPLALAVSRETQLLCAGILAIGLLHRRLKRWQAWKPAYVAAAWVAVTAGIPALSALDPAPLPWVFGVYACAIGANLIATGLRSELRPRTLRTARAFGIAGVVLAGVAPEPASALLPIPACELAALCTFRPGERYGLIILDGALLAGALATLTWTTIT